MKRLLALLALALSALLWVEGLLGSLQRPSVLDSLGLRQLELAALAAEGLPEPLRAATVGDDPRGELADELQRQIEAAAAPPPAQRRLELALLRRSDPGVDPSEPPSSGEGMDTLATLRGLISSVDAARRPLLEALIAGTPVGPERQRQLLAPWGDGPMLAQLGCEQLGGPVEVCPARRQKSRWLLQLIGVNGLPALLLLMGIVLLLRELWLMRYGRLPPAAPLLGPPLSPVDVTLLIAGGFVLVGEVLVPLLLQATLQSSPLSGLFSAPTGRGLEVLLLYLALMVAPLALYRLLLPRRSAAPEGGWLQWHWRPFATALGAAGRTVLQVMPFVALASWLVDRVWSDPGGSNPLLDMVLTNSDPMALLFFALTATVLAPLFEESLFRGMLLPVAAQRLGAPWAILISALVFALAHLSLSELLPLFVLGVGLGWLRWRSGRLASTVLMHSLWNALTFVNLLFLAG